MHVFASDSRAARTRGWAVAVVALCLALAACGVQGTQGAAPPPPQGWTDITPPDSGQSAQYVVSPDIPGLIFAVIGGRAQISAAPLPTGRLWRSRDSGASWQSLDSSALRTGPFLVMPPGGHGLIFAQDSASASISVSTDEGTTWRTLPFVATPFGAMTGEWRWLSGAVAIGGRLYAGGVSAGFGGMRDGTYRFSVSDDHGFTWRAIETGADPAGANTATVAIAPLDATGSSWLRLVAAGAWPSTSAIFERSADGGVTWSIVSQPPVSTTGLHSAQLATDAAHPGVVCAALTRVDFASSSPPATYTTPSTGGAFHGGAAIAGPPAPEPTDVSLLASGDGGHTWHGGVVTALRRQYGGAVSPGPQLGADGACYLATSQSDSLIGPPANEQATLWRLSPGAAAPTAVFRMTDRGILSLALLPGDTAGGEQIVALTRISGPNDGQQISCGSGCMTYRNGGIYRLIAEPLPPA